MHAQGQDHHAKVMIDLHDAYRGAKRSISLRMPVLDAQGRVATHERTLDVSIPKGVRAGQHLRLAGQGGPGPVSYTHLDVYKRQGLAADGGPGIPGVAAQSGRQE